MDSTASVEGDSNNCADNQSAANSESVTKALANKEILEHMFALLNPESFKNCRMVCRLWKTVGEVLFKDNYRICFDFKKYTQESDNAPGPEDLRSFFQNAQQVIPFKAMKLKGRLIWSQTAITEFFESEGRFIKDLILDEVSLAVIVREGLRSKKENKYHRKCDFSTLFGGIINLKHLKISGYRNTTIFKLTMGLLSNIQTIHLENCEIELGEHVLKPIELRLAGVGFYRENQLVKNILLNDFVDQGCLERTLYVDDRPSNNLQLTKLQVDFCGPCKIDSLFLFQVEVLNLKSSSWKIERSAFFIDVLFQEKINFSTKSLNIVMGSCDLHWLPEYCVDVHLDKGQLVDEILQSGFNRPNVKCLHMCNREFAKPILPHLNSIFINLEELHLEFGEVGDVNIEITNLPQKLTKIFLNDDRIRFIGDGVKKLHVLSQTYTNFESVEILLKHFTPENLIVFIKDLQSTDTDIFLVELANNSAGKMIVGLFVDKFRINSSCTADVSPFPSANKVGEFYAFINGNGGIIKWKSYIEAQLHFRNEQ